MNRLPVVVVLCLSLSACSDPAEPADEFANCREDADIAICIEESRYAAGDPVTYRVTSTRSEAVFKDRCTGAVEGRPSSEEPWAGSYGFSRGCSHGDPSQEEVVAAMRPLPSEGSMLTNAEAYEDGEWRITLQILDAEGQPVRAEPFHSPIFRLAR